MAEKKSHSMAGMDMSKMPGMGDPNQAVNNSDPTKNQQGMDTPAPPLQASSPFMSEGMKNMPKATPKQVWTVTGTENWEMLRGFGPAAGMVAMMNGMMVGGGPMQSMKMGKMDMRMAEMPAPTPEQARTAAADTSAPTPEATNTAMATTQVSVAVMPDPPVVGDNKLDIIVTDAAGKPVTGLKLAATVAMVTMDMGTAHPPVMDMGKGHYRTTVSFSMAGPWRLTLAGGGDTNAVKKTMDFQAGSKAATNTTSAQDTPVQDKSGAALGPLTVAAALSSQGAKVGDGNLMTVTVTDAAGEPVTGATVTSAVAMITMDMGTTHPAFKDAGGGKYQGKVGFGMAGPWRVTVKVIAPGQKPQTKAFDFTAK